MAYLAELLAVTTDWLKIVRIHARNVHCVYGNKRLDDDASLSRYRKATALCSRCTEAPSCWNTKNSSRDTVHANIWQWPLSKKVVATVCHLHS